MVLPKKTFVALAGHTAWHLRIGAPCPRASGKYLPSQLRTQKAGPEPDATGRGAVGAGCWLRPNESAKKFACAGAWRCCFWAPPKKKSNRPSADAMRGASTTELASVTAATSI